MCQGRATLAVATNNKKQISQVELSGIQCIQICFWCELLDNLIGIIVNHRLSVFQVTAPEKVPTNTNSNFEQRSFETFELHPNPHAKDHRDTVIK